MRIVKHCVFRYRPASHWLMRPVFWVTACSTARGSILLQALNVFTMFDSDGVHSGGDCSTLQEKAMKALKIREGRGDEDVTRKLGSRHSIQLSCVQRDVGKLTAQQQWERGRKMKELRYRGATVQFRFSAVLKMMWRDEMSNVREVEEADELLKQSNVFTA
ncbi:hypothetical protein NDU88_005702 [Pleurodeles waltl]|uniref:Uncharacterized protein n=1 Tax=Pleurodeles waltl TaxID=8319 RepID=A0AAV7TBI2_PLEWA|nr:hypothetical protein NDU88_005702 [Pleurodeles waltl]